MAAALKPIYTAATAEQSEPVPERRGGLQDTLPCLEKNREKMDDADQGLDAGDATIRDRVRRQNAVTLNLHSIKTSFPLAADFDALPQSR